MIDWRVPIVSLLALLVPFTANAGMPDVQTPTPVIYLADNLDEQENLGWCIDTIGRGFGETLQAHSCKPQGGDVQFTTNAAGQIASVAFDGKCLEIVDPSNAAVPFGLLDCADKPSQLFVFDPATSEFHPRSDPSLCISVATTSRSAGPFMSRDLKLEPCAAVEPQFKQWVTKP